MLSVGKFRQEWNGKHLLGSYREAREPAVSTQHLRASDTTLIILTLCLACCRCGQGTQGKRA